MKKIFTFASLFLLPLCLNALQVSIQSGVFGGGTIDTYLETYIRVSGSSVTFLPVAEGDTKIMGSVEITIFLKRDGDVIGGEKYVLNSPVLDEITDLLDVKRFAVTPGNYQLTIEAHDVKDPSNNTKISQSITVQNCQEAVCLSDIQLYAAVSKVAGDHPLAKNGVLMEPFDFNTVSDDYGTLHFYFETYRKDLQTSNFVKYSVSMEDEEGNRSEVMKRVKKLKELAVEPQLHSLPINELQSGEYILSVDILDKSQNVVATKETRFTRSNIEYDIQLWKGTKDDGKESFFNYMSVDEVDYALRATAPIVYEPMKSVLDYMVEDAPIVAKKKFLHKFWSEKYPTNMEAEFNNYLEFAKAIDLQYNSNVGYGFETDRGYIFLRYGKPNNVMSVDQEPEAYPYEIWYYDKMLETNQMNVRFIFYNQSLVHNDYALLHSTCRVERQNPAWEIELYRRGTNVIGASALDDTEAGDGWNRMARQYFNDY